MKFIACIACVTGTQISESQKPPYASFQSLLLYQWLLILISTLDRTSVPHFTSLQILV